MKNEENNNKLRFVIIYGLILVFVIIMELFICKTAYALELAIPDNEINISGTTYYGYNIPTRPTNLDTNYLTFSNTQKMQDTNGNYINNWLTLYKNNIIYKVRNPNSTIMDYLSSKDISITQNIWSDTIDLMNESNNTNYNMIRYNNVSFAFHPAENTDDIMEMFDSGYKLDYSLYYSYTFDFIIYNKSGLDFEYNLQPNQFFNLCHLYTIDNQENMSCTSSYNSYFNVENIYSDNYIRYYRVSIPFNLNIKYGFNNGVNILNTNQTGMFGKYIITIATGVKNRVFTGLGNNDTMVVVSQPYNITAYSTENVVLCDNNCWTQQDTNRNQDYSSSDYLNDFSTSIKLYGFKGIIDLTFDFIRSVLSSANVGCYELDIPIFNTHIYMPSSCTFWNRQDITTFKTLYETIWLGAVSYLLGWKIFKDLLNLYNPSSPVVSGKEIDSL